MPVRKKVVKKKVTKHKVKKTSKFSLKRLIAPFLVLALLVGVLAYNYIPGSTNPSSSIASESPFGKKISLHDGGYLKIPISRTDSFNQALCRTRSIEFILEPNMSEIGGNGARILNRLVPSSNGGVSGPYYVSMSPEKKLLVGVKANSGNSGGAGITSTTIFEPGSSHHIALEYVTLGSDTSKQGLYLFVDGKLEGFDQSANGNLYCPPGGELIIGSADTPFTGMIDELRFSTVPRYAPNQSFSVPTEPFVSDANTSGLWHFDGDLNDYGLYKKPFQAVGKYLFNYITPSPTPTVEASKGKEDRSQRPTRTIRKNQKTSDKQ